MTNHFKPFKHLLALEGMPLSVLTEIFDLAEQYRQHTSNPALTTCLQHYTVANLFFEPSTRTRTSSSARSSLAPLMDSSAWRSISSSRSLTAPLTSLYAVVSSSESRWPRRQAGLGSGQAARLDLARRRGPRAPPAHLRLVHRRLRHRLPEGRQGAAR